MRQIATALAAVAAVALAGCGGHDKPALPPGTIEFEAQFAGPLPSGARVGMPARIEGVDVGRVVALERSGDSATLRLRTRRPDARPIFVIHADAQVKLRPRIFESDAWFLDLYPGSPAAAPMKTGDRIPPTRTSMPVQYSQILPPAGP